MAYLRNKRRARLVDNDTEGYRQICYLMESKQESIYSRIEQTVCKELHIPAQSYDDQYSAIMTNEEQKAVWQHRYHEA